MYGDVDGKFRQSADDLPQSLSNFLRCQSALPIRAEDKKDRELLASISALEDGKIRERAIRPSRSSDGSWRLTAMPRYSISNATSGKPDQVAIIPPCRTTY